MTSNKKEEETTKTSTVAATKATQEPICGIVMPIASMPEYTERHWGEVLTIIKEAAEIAGYDKARLVSDSESINIIQKDIVQNLYTDEVIICDVSGRNPNVLFELGMRLTFDKPTVIVKDNVTNYIFDIGAIKHIEYPRDLNYHAIIKFKKELSEKIKGTVDAYKKPNFTTFLKHFKDITIKPAKLDKEEISQSDAILKRLDKIDNDLNVINGRTSRIGSRDVSKQWADIIDNSLDSGSGNVGSIGINDMQKFIHYSAKPEMEIYFKEMSDDQIETLPKIGDIGYSSFLNSSFFKESVFLRKIKRDGLRILYKESYQNEVDRRNLFVY